MSCIEIEAVFEGKFADKAPFTLKECRESAKYIGTKYNT